MCPTQRILDMGRAQLYVLDAGASSGTGVPDLRDSLPAARPLSRAACRYWPHASISVMRDHLPSVLVMLTRIAFVVNAEKLTLRLTRLLPLTAANVTQLDPFQPCTLKPVTPYSENVNVSVGST